MKQISSLFTDRCLNLLSECSGIADLLNEKAASCQVAFYNWLLRCEQLLNDFNRPEKGRIASVRALLIMSEQGVFAENGIDTSGLPSARKKRFFVIAQGLNEASGIMYQLYQQEEQKLDQARALINQLLLFAIQHQVLAAELAVAPASQADLQNVISVFSRHEEIRKGLQQARMLVSYPDILRLLDEAMTRVYTAAQAHEGANLRVG